MRYPASVLTILALLGIVRADAADHAWQIQGLVVDEHGVPVEDFEAATFWSSNGKLWKENGELIRKVTSHADAALFWKDEGLLAANPNRAAKRLAEGKFSLTIEEEPLVSILAVDKRHERGGIVSVEQSNAEKPVTIKIVPLVRVSAKIYCSEAGRTPDWSTAVVYVADDNQHQNKGRHSKLMLCGSMRGEVSLLLPPGKYELDVYSRSPDARIQTSTGQADKDDMADSPSRGMCIEIPHGKTTLDLGVLNVVLPKDKDGIARDYSQFYGKAPPELAITDARGVSNKVKLADFRGKWVLLDFWTLSCGPCIAHSLPELTRFYEEHAAGRDRFEILAICNTETEKARTIEAFEALVAPIVEMAWSGKPLLFPVLIDGEGKTSSIYGIQRWPTVLLIDPEGNLVKNGDLAMLAEKLKGTKP